MFWMHGQLENIQLSYAEQYSKYSIKNEVVAPVV